MVACRSMVFGSSCAPRMPMASSASFRSPLRVHAAAKIPMPPLNPRDPFLSRLSAAAAAAPQHFLKASVNSSQPPYLDILEGVPKLMATPAQGEHSYGYNQHRARKPPPDLPSILLDGRIVYIGMPLVPAVTELVIAELLYLEWANPLQPIYVYINSPGTTRDDGIQVAIDSQALAVYDIMMQLKAEIYTLGLGAAMGYASLFLACGKKGKRFMLQHAKAMIHQPQIPPTGLRQASDIINRANEVIKVRDIYFELLAKHTGNSFEDISKMASRKFFMRPEKAKEFGFIDKILVRDKHQEKLMSDVRSAEEFDRLAGIRDDDD